MLVEERAGVGDPMMLSFTAPTLWDPLVLRVRVAWVDAGSHGRAGAGAEARVQPHRLGLAFEHKGPDGVFALYELIMTFAYE